MNQFSFVLNRFFAFGALCSKAFLRPISLRISGNRGGSIGAILLALFLVIGSSRAEAFDLRIGDTLASKIAKSMHIPGKGVAGECLVYATELNKLLQAAGIDSRVVAYHTRKLGTGDREYGEVKGHAVVVYNDKGRIYVMDNESWRPRWVGTGAPRAMIAQFGGLDQQIERAWAIVNPGTVSPGDASVGKRQISGTR